MSMIDVPHDVDGESDQIYHIQNKDPRRAVV